MSENATGLFEDASRTSSRVLPLISDTGNRKQLADWIDSHEFLEYVPFEDELEAIDFDVCILDKGALRDHRQELARINAEAEPVIVPYLLLVPEYDESLIEFEQEQLIDAVTPGSVDEIARIPLKQRELEWRVRALLRLRNQSIRAHTTSRRYQSLFESIRDAILVADTDRKIVDCNQAFTDLFGYSLADIAGKPTHTVYESKAEFEKMGDAIQEHAGDPELTKIVSYERKSGEVFPGETNVFYLRDQDGDIQGFIGLIRDVSERLERERELERYEAAVEGSTDMLVAADRDRQVVFANEQCRNLLGHTQADIRGSHLREVLGNDEFEEIEPHFEQALNGKEGQFTREQRPEEGETRILEVSYYPLQEEEGDEITGVVASLRDITEREHRKRELREFKQAVDAAGHAIYLTNLDGEIRYANDAFEDITGYTPAEAIGQNPRMLKSGKMSEGYYEELWDTVTDGEIWVEEVINRRKNGELYHARQTIAPILNDQDEPEGYVAIQTDITAQRDQAQKLQEYKQAVESANDLLAAVDTDLEIVFANETYAQYHDVDHDSLVGEPLPEFLGPERFAEVEDRVRRALQGERRQVEIQRTHPNRGPRTLDAQIYPIYVDDTIHGVGAAMRDVTERKQRERQLQTLISNLPGIVYHCRNEKGWPMDLVRGRSQELSGYSANQIESGEVSWGDDIIHPDDQTRVWEEVQDALNADDPFELTYRIRTREGDTRWVWERGQQVTPVGSASSRLEGFITDITHRKQLEAELRDAKERYESLFTSIQDAILVADTDRRIINCNPAFEELFGYDLDEIKGKPTSFIYASEAEFEGMGEAIEGPVGDPEFTHPVEYEKKSGQIFPGETSVFYLRDQDDEIAGFIGVIRDVSNRRTRLKQLKIIDRILQHKFHNDMTVIEGNAELAKEQAGDQIAPFISTVLETSEDMRNTVDKEREITKFLAEKPPQEAINIRATIDDTLSRLRDRGLSATFSVTGPDEAFVFANVAIGMALEELLTNAAKHSERADPNVMIEIESTVDLIHVRVIDEGPPIPEMEREVLTGEKELSPLYHGSGLGLWLVHLIVENSDGTVDFAVTDDGGNIVSMRLLRATENTE